MISLVTGSAVRPERAEDGRGTGFRRAAELIVAFLAAWPEFGKRDLLVDLLEDDLDRHADSQLVVRAVDDVRVEADAFLELDDRHIVGHVVREARVLRPVDHDERVDRPPPGKPRPFVLEGATLRTHDARREAEVA